MKTELLISNDEPIELPEEEEVVSLTVKMRDSARNQIAADVEAFLASGGSIVESPIIRREFTSETYQKSTFATGHSATQLRNCQNYPKTASSNSDKEDAELSPIASMQNIIAYKKIDGSNAFSVTVRRRHFGTFYDVKLAQRARDNARQELCMPPVAEDKFSCEAWK